MRQKIESLYLSYFNDFLTVKKFSEYYGISVEKATRIINIGRKINHARIKQ
jgi:hypothetical protein